MVFVLSMQYNTMMYNIKENDDFTSSSFIIFVSEW